MPPRRFILDAKFEIDMEDLFGPVDTRTIKDIKDDIEDLLRDANIEMIKIRVEEI